MQKKKKRINNKQEQRNETNEVDLSTAVGVLHWHRLKISTAHNAEREGQASSLEMSSGWPCSISNGQREGETGGGGGEGGGTDCSGSTVGPGTGKQ